MNKKANILFLSLLVFLSFELYARTPPKVKKACHAIWTVETEFGQGTGFFTSSDRFLTNLHVVEEALMENQFESIYLKQNQDIKNLKGIVGFSINPDLVILETETESDTYLSLRTDPLNEDEKLFLTGYPDNKLRIIETIGPIKKHTGELVASTNASDFIKGASGSPLLDSKARVAGVLYRANRSATVSSSHTALQKFIEENQNKVCTIPKSNQCLINLTKHFLKKTESENATTTDLLMLSLIYKEGRLGFEKNPKKAYQLINRAVQRGDLPIAKFYKALFLYSGEGVEQDYKQAFELFSELAKEGYLDALFNVAVMYFYGEGVEQDQKQAFELFSELASQGHKSASYRVGTMLFHGEGVNQNYEESFKILSPLAKEGDLSALSYTAMMLFEGNGVEQNIKQAFKAFDKLEEKLVINQ